MITKQKCVCTFSGWETWLLYHQLSVLLSAVLPWKLSKDEALAPVSLPEEHQPAKQ